ncbi:uncharacterized protein [Littorina saxatilis]|uniref:Uncharacterized protein n=1 Tax=Littorina saxatilis TaxID=31220 RepID=A0AAN9B3W4_9CAEN
MPTLRRSKSLNDKITRQKNRTGDIIRDPRSPDVEGRTRTCVDNFQALVHLRKQTEDRARQLELALNYATNGHNSSSTYTRPPSRSGVPTGAVELPYSPISTTSVTSTSVKSPRQPEPADSKIPGLYSNRRRQRSAEGRREEPDHGGGGGGGGGGGRAVRRQESFQDSHLHHLRQGGGRVSQQGVGQKCQRPVSMFEPRGGIPAVGGGGGKDGGGVGGGGGGGGLFPSPDELSRKDQVIASLTEGKKSVERHNQQLLSKMDELEFQNQRLKDALAAHNTPSHSRCHSQPSTPSQPHQHHHLTRPYRTALTPQSDVIRIPTLSSPSAAMSPNSETSVSGYGSLADSHYGDTGPPHGSADAGVGLGLGLERAVQEVEDYDDDTLPLSEVCGEEGGRLGSRDSHTLALSSSSSGDSRPPTLHRESDKSDVESVHEKSDQELDQERQKGVERERRIEELEKMVAYLSSQRETVLTRYKQIVDENDKLLKRDERVNHQLQSLVDNQGQSLNFEVLTELQNVQEELWDLSHEVRSQVDSLLAALQASTSSGPEMKEQVISEPEAKELLNKITDFIGPDSIRLGKQLSLSPTELDKIDKAAVSVSEKSHKVLDSWLRQWEAHGETPPSHDLDLAFRAIDKDICLFNQTPISGPERQALRNCLQYVIDHVTDPRDVLDHLISLNELTPAGINFVQQVLEQRERALSRLWHVCEYRGTDIVSRLGLAMERSSYPHISARLTDELAIQNSRLHSKSLPANEEPEDVTAPSKTSAPVTASAAASATAPAPTASSASVSQPLTSQARSRLASRVPRPRSKTAESGTGRSTERAFSPTFPAGEKQTPPLTQIGRPRFTPQQKDKQFTSSLLNKTQVSPRSVEGSPQREKQTTPPLYKDRRTASPAHKEGRTNQQRDRSSDRIPCLQKDRQITQPYQKERQTERQLSYHRDKDKQKEKQITPSSKSSRQAVSQTAPPIVRDREPGPAPQKERQTTIWDRRVAASYAVRGSAASRGTVVLEQGSKISRV